MNWNRTSTKITQMAAIGSAALLVVGWMAIHSPASEKPLNRPITTAALSKASEPIEAETKEHDPKKEERAVATSGETSLPNTTEPAPTTLSEADQKFVRNAAAISLLETELARLARDNSGTEEVVTLADELLSNQTRTAAALRELARLKNVDVSTELTPEHEKVFAGFKSKLGQQFDQAFREYVTNDRSNSLRVFAEGARTVKDPDIRLFAEQVLGELKEQRPIAAAAASNSGSKTAAHKPGTKDSKKASASKTSSSSGKAKAPAQATVQRSPLQSTRDLPPVASGEPESAVSSRGYADPQVPRSRSRSHGSAVRETADTSILESEAAPVTRSSRSRQAEESRLLRAEPVRRQPRVIYYIRRPAPGWHGY